MSNSFLLWCHQESNRGHKDFQSFALPTELWHQHYVANIAGAKVRLIFDTCKFFAKNFSLIVIKQKK